MTCADGKKRNGGATCSVGDRQRDRGVIHMYEDC